MSNNSENEEGRKPIAAFAGRELIITVFYDRERGVVTLNVSRLADKSFQPVGRVRVARSKFAISLAEVFKDAKAELERTLQALT